MKDDADPCTACERLDIIEAMLDTLAERLDQGNTTDEATDTDTGHQADHHTDTEDLPHE